MAICVQFGTTFFPLCCNCLLRTRWNSGWLQEGLIPSFLTDLSNPETPLSSLFQNYAFVLFFVDMQNERTWRICRKGIAETTISYALLKSCLVVKDCGEREGE